MTIPLVRCHNLTNSMSLKFLDVQSCIVPSYTDPQGELSASASTMASVSRIAVTVCTVLLLACGITALDNGLARTPPMGWNSWNHIHCDVNCTEYPELCLNEKHIEEIADAIVSSGMKKAGYLYVNLDDCWLAQSRDAHGRLQPDPSRFPSGIKALADYVHSKGLKFGIYEDCGEKTCAGYPGSYGHEVVDAQTYAEWEVDYLKLDGCNIDKSEYKEKYTETMKALNASGRHIVYSCSWPAYIRDPASFDWKYLGEICNLWRYYNDIRDTYDAWRKIADYTAENQQYYAPAAGPGQWNDPDMLDVGNGGQTSDQYRGLFSVWSILAAPLIAGNDPRNMTNETLSILLNEEVIAVDQDVAGVQGRRVEDHLTHQIWVRHLHDGSYAAVLLNKLPFQSDVELTWPDLGLPTDTPAKVRDLWMHEDKGVHTKRFTAAVPSEGVVMVRVVPQ